MKHTYEKPETKLIKVECEGIIATSGNREIHVFNSYSSRPAMAPSDDDDEPIEAAKSFWD